MEEQTQPLVGRDRELEILEALLGQAEQGAPQFAQVTGEPGIGKSSLLAKLGRRANEGGWLVLNGRCAELEREIPFGLVIDAFDAYLASLGARAFERIASDELEELAGLFPSLRSLVPEPAYPTTPSERIRAHRAVAEMIARLAGQQPVLLLLDDLHWADGASVEQAGYVLRRPPEAAVMIVGSYRTGQADPALMAAVAGAARDGYVELLELGPLGRDDAAKLVGSAATRDGLYEASGGNPFYMLQLARGRDSKGVRARVGDGDAGAVPAVVAAAIAAELEALSPQARALCDAAAVAGDPFDLDVAVDTAGVDEAEALTLIDELTERDIIRAGAVPRTFQFRHPLVRSAVYAAAAPGARLAAHQRAAQSLAARGAPASERAHHVLHAARRGDLEAVGVLREAGTEAAGRAPASAARWFEAALRLLPTDPAAGERLGLQMSLAGSQAAMGRMEDAHTALVAAIDLAADGDGPIPRERIISACAAVEHLLGRYGEAHQRLVSALKELDDDGTPEAAGLMVDLGVDAFYRMDYKGVAPWSMKAAAAAEKAGTETVRATALALAAFGYSMAGPVENAHARCDEATALVDGFSDETLAQRLDSIAWLCAAEFYLDRYPTGEAHARRGLEIARASAQGEVLPALTQALGNFLHMSGRPVESGELFEEAIDSARLTDNALSLAWSLLNRGYAAVIEGDLEAALAAGEEAYALTREFSDSPVGAWAGATYGAALLESEQYARAVDIFMERAGGPEAPLIPGAWRANWLEWVTRAFIGADRLEDARRAAETARARAEEFGLDVALAGAKRAQAEVALADGEPSVAAELAVESADHADRAAARVEAGLSRIVAGIALAELVENERAIENLEQAARDLDASRATRHRDRAERELGKLGHRTHRRTRAGAGDGVASLTGRELEIARLVVDRRTNPEIAAELFLSVKTVETHMRNIFRKLDVNSRVEVARVVEAHAAE